MSASFARVSTPARLALWNPWAGFGQPMLANPAAQVLYPLHLAEPPARAGGLLRLYAVGHLLLASSASSRSRGSSGSSTAASVAGGAFRLRAPLLSYVTLWHHFAGVAWMPWVLLAAERRARSALRAGRRRLGRGRGVQVLAGSLDSS